MPMFTMALPAHTDYYALLDRTDSTTKVATGSQAPCGEGAKEHHAV